VKSALNKGEQLGRYLNLWRIQDFWESNIYIEVWGVNWSFQARRLEMVGGSSGQKKDPKARDSESCLRHTAIHCCWNTMHRARNWGWQKMGWWVGSRAGKNHKSEHITGTVPGRGCSIPSALCICDSAKFTARYSVLPGIGRASNGSHYSQGWAWQQMPPKCNTHTISALWSLKVFWQKSSLDKTAGWVQLRSRWKILTASVNQELGVLGVEEEARMMG
jgi:hypothetical protein